MSDHKIEIKSLNRKNHKDLGFSINNSLKTSLTQITPAKKEKKTKCNQNQTKSP